MDQAEQKINIRIYSAWDMCGEWKFKYIWPFYEDMHECLNIFGKLKYFEQIIKYIFFWFWIQIRIYIKWCVAVQISALFQILTPKDNNLKSKVSLEND